MQVTQFSVTRAMDHSSICLSDISASERLVEIYGRFFSDLAPVWNRDWVTGEKWRFLI